MVRVRFSFGSRHTGRIGNIRKQRGKYPEVMRKVIDVSDIVLEILDARYIEETRNIEIEELVLNSGLGAARGIPFKLGTSKKVPSSSGKVLVYVFNKCDLVDRKEIEKQIPDWMRPYVFVSATKGIGLNELKGRVKMEAKRILAARKSAGGIGVRGVEVSEEGNKKFEKKKHGVGKVKLKAEEKMAKEMRDESWGRVHVGVVGVPNVGKSSVINFITRRAAAKTAARAGFTKGMQKIRMSDGILVLDTPGVIPESRYTSEKKGFAEDVKIGARSYSDVHDPERAVSFLVKGRSKVEGRRSKVEGEALGVDDEVDEEFVERDRLVDEEGERNALAIGKFYGIEFGRDVEILIEELGRKRGFLVKGGVVDEDRTARLILRDWQEGRIRVG